MKNDKTIRPLDIVDVKAGIRASRLFVQIRYGHLLLGDFQTGEAVSLSDIEVKAVKHAIWRTDGTCSNCNCVARWPHSDFCPHCGAQMDGEY